MDGMFSPENELFVVLPVFDGGAFKIAESQGHGKYILNDSWPIERLKYVEHSRDFERCNPKKDVAVRASHIVYKFVTVKSVPASVLRMQYSDCAKAHAWVINGCPRHHGLHDDSPRHGEKYSDYAA